jgi:hypothetical protein
MRKRWASAEARAWRKLRNHGADQQAWSLIAECTGLEARAWRRQRQRLLLIGRGSASERRPARLIGLIGPVGKAADQGEATELGRRCRQRATSLRAQDQRTEAAERRPSAQAVVADQRLELGQNFIGGLAGQLLEGLARML